MSFTAVAQRINECEKTLALKLLYDPGVAAFSFS
jgi:hypothetical protein